MQMEGFSSLSISAPKKKEWEKTVESRDIWLMFQSRSTEKQAGCVGKAAVCDGF